MTFDEWWESPTDGWYLGCMATDDEKRYSLAAWNAATLAERERCAGICDRFGDREMHPAECAAAIRIGKE